MSIADLQRRNRKGLRRSHGWVWVMLLGLEELGVQHSSASGAYGRQKCLNSAETPQGFRHKTFEGDGPGACLGVGECTAGRKDCQTLPVEHILLKLHLWGGKSGSKDVWVKDLQSNSPWFEDSGIWRGAELMLTSTLVHHLETLVLRNFHTKIMGNIWTLDDSRLHLQFSRILRLALYKYIYDIYKYTYICKIYIYVCGYLYIYIS